MQLCLGIDVGSGRLSLLLGVVRKDLQRMGLTCKEADATALSTDKNFVGVWPSAFTWTQVESSPPSRRSRSHVLTIVSDRRFQ